MQTTRSLPLRWPGTTPAGGGRYQRCSSWPLDDCAEFPVRWLNHLFARLVPPVAVAGTCGRHLCPMALVAADVHSGRAHPATVGLVGAPDRCQVLTVTRSRPGEASHRSSRKPLRTRSRSPASDTTTSSRWRSSLSDTLPLGRTELVDGLSTRALRRSGPPQRPGLESIRSLPDEDVVSLIGPTDLTHLPLPGLSGSRRSARRPGRSAA